MQVTSITTAFAVSCITARALAQFQILVGFRTVAEIVGIGEHCPKIPKGIHSKNSATSLAKSFCFHECSTKLRKNPSVLKKSCTLFRMSEIPLAKFEKTFTEILLKS